VSTLVEAILSTLVEDILSTLVELVRSVNKIINSFNLYCSNFIGCPRRVVMEYAVS
jgi:hypothetical protein